MQNFEVTIRRHVSKIDEFTRVITAESEDEAQLKAEELASSSDDNCPDDCAETDYLALGDFYVEEITETDEEADED